MTIAEAISNADKLTPNTYPIEMKINWLSNLDGQIYKEIYMTHENCPIESFSGYDSSSMQTELLVPFPYDEGIYTYFLQKNIHKENGEAARHNRAVTLYNNAFQQFQDYYNRSHMPIGNGTRFIF